MNGKIFNSQNYVSGYKKQYFEGWYFKITLCGEILSFIVGICKNKTDPHAFIQYIDAERSGYYRFAADSFAFEKQDMSIKIQNNTFSLKGIKADIKDIAGDIVCDLEFDNVQLYKKSLYAPSVMGPFSYLPMQCAHAVVAVNMCVSGLVVSGCKSVQGNGCGYIEKDFGTSFPENYIWLHAHEPPQKDDAISIVFALAHPLVFGIKGYICIFSIGKKQYNLSLYTLSKLKAQISNGSFRFSLKKGGVHLRAEATFCDDGFRSLTAPNNGNMRDIVKETVQARLLLEYQTKRKSGCATLAAAFEMRGSIAQMLNK